MAGHHDDAGDKQGTLRAPNAVGQPRTENGGQVNAAAVRADNAAGQGFIHTQTALTRGVIQINQQDALHTVEGKTLPQLNME